MSPSAPAKERVSLPGTERLVVRSSATGVEYQIDVALPAGYEGSDKRYPTFYILDGNLEFPTAVHAYRCQRVEEIVPETIVVGIGYPEDDANITTPGYMLSRARDYTPTALRHKPNANELEVHPMEVTGKAQAFLEFIKQQLIPLIDGRYRTDPRDRGLGGHSFGGLFTTHALLTEPSIFNRYWIGSPSLWFNDGEPFTWIEAATERAVKPRGRLFLSVGALETEIMVPPMRRMEMQFASSFASLEISSQVFPDETHMSVLGASINRALRILYAKKALPLARAKATEYLGKWQAQSGETMTVRLDGDRLLTAVALSHGIAFEFELAAESTDQCFFVHYDQIQIAFERDATGKVQRMRRVMFGQQTSFRREGGGHA